MADGIKQIDIKTRNILTMIGNFHPNTDIDKLYVHRKSGAEDYVQLRLCLKAD